MGIADWRNYLLKPALFAGFTALVVGCILTFAGPEPTLAQMNGHGQHRHGADGTGHDMVRMPGLQGLDTTPEETAEMAVMFRNFPRINREVENLPNGIRTHTWSDDPDIRSVVVSHVVGMITRVEEGRDPKVFIQSPTLDILFERRDRISTEIEATDTGVLVTQTSDDAEVVAALQTHAAEVSDMAARGMQAVHEAMMLRNR
ncbi:hypothetical protein [Roseibium sp.]|uniref:hypothetical protein n=1 Tax=Roseibium sp. TaxID=1936156 RepID=UPI003A986588